MSVYIVCDGTTYSDIKFLRFAPEYDPTLATLPICEFEAEIVTDDAPEDVRFKWMNLREDLGYENATNDLLAGRYYSVETEQIGRGVLRVRAQSLLGILDSRVLAAELFTNALIETFVERLFTDSPLNDGAMIFVDPPVTVDSQIEPYVRYVSGFCPQQTARERLQWLLQAKMLRVVQYGQLSEDGLYITSSVDRNDAGFSGRHETKYISPENTYKKPKLKAVGSTHNFTAVRYGNFTYTETKGRDWGSSVIRQDWDMETQQWVDVLVYYRMYPLQVNDGTGDLGDPVTVSGNTLMSSGDTYVFQAMAQTYFRGYEVEADILQIKADGTNDSYIWPGDRVWFYTDMDTVCIGVVKSIDFTFGALAKSKLVIATDAVPVAVAYVDMHYRYQGTFAVRHMTFPVPYIHYDSTRPLYVKNPPYYYMEEGEVTILHPNYDQTEIYNNSGEGTTMTYYVDYRTT